MMQRAERVFHRRLFCSDWYPDRGPAFDDMVVGYREIAYLGGWWGGDVGSIGSYTSVPSRFRSPLAYFLVRPLVPEPPVTLLVAVGVAAIAAAIRRRPQRSNRATSVE